MHYVQMGKGQKQFGVHYAVHHVIIAELEIMGAHYVSIADTQIMGAHYVSIAET